MNENEEREATYARLAAAGTEMVEAGKFRAKESFSLVWSRAEKVIGEAYGVLRAVPIEHRSEWLRDAGALLLKYSNAADSYDADSLEKAEEVAQLIVSKTDAPVYSGPTN